MELDCRVRCFESAIWLPDIRAWWRCVKYLLGQCHMCMMESGWGGGGYGRVQVGLGQRCGFQLLIVGTVS